MQHLLLTLDSKKKVLKALKNEAEIKYSSSYKSIIFSLADVKEYRDLTIRYRDRKCALKSSNDGKCWWVYQFILTNPNRMVGRW